MRAWFLPACRGGDGARFHGPRPAAGGAVPPSCRVPVAAAGYEKPGANTVTCGFPVTVCLVAGACRNFGRAFCARGEWRWRPGMFRVCRAARAAASAAAASASSDDDAVTWEDVMDRIAWRQTAVKDSSSAVTGALSFRRRARAAAVSAAQRGGGAGAHELGGGEPGPGFLDDQPRGPGPQDRAARCGSRRR